MCVGCPTERVRQTSASEARVGEMPRGCVMQGLGAMTLPTAALRMKRQSEATGSAPELTGWAQEPWPATARPADPTTAVASTTEAVRRETLLRRMNCPPKEHRGGARDVRLPARHHAAAD